MLSNEQSKIFSHFENAVKCGKAAQAYIISGSEGLGKRELAFYLKLLFACEKGESCGTCPSCLAAKKGAHPDIVTLSPKEGKGYLIDEIRELIATCYKKSQGAYKLIIIEKAHLLGEKCQNALLKTIEEPPSFAVFIFLTDSLGAILPTIRSRCQVFSLSPWSDKEMREAFGHLVQNDELYIYANGNPKVLLGTIDDKEYREKREIVFSSFEKVFSDDPYGVHEAQSDWLSKKESAAELFGLADVLLRDVLLYKFGQKDKIINTDKITKIQSIAQRLSPLKALKVAELVRQKGANLARSENLSMTFLAMFICIKEEIND